MPDFREKISCVDLKFSSQDKEGTRFQRVHHICIKKHNRLYKQISSLKEYAGINKCNEKGKI